VCLPWSEKKQDLPAFTGDESLAQKAWEQVDRLGYNFCWVNLTW
jgi:hypothetical protein